ncbi:hypothetical protein [Pontibacter sp. H249]|uniref:hypothetical protein n=1 Tax=Pontibacter sp. H249 TaxID=3133420 RepID=UPI0030BFAAFC
MKTIIGLICFTLASFLAGCTKEDNITPCVNARVVDVSDPCSGGVVLELVKEEFATGNGFCGTPNIYKYVTVDNLPEDLKYVGARFTCQIEETNAGKACIAIYAVYQTATIRKVCSRQDTAPVVAAEKK